MFVRGITVFRAQGTLARENTHFPRSSAHLKSRPGKAPTFRALPSRPKSTPPSVTGFREPPRKPAWLKGNSLHDNDVLRFCCTPTGPLQLFHHGDHILWILLLLHLKHLFHRSMDSCGLTDAGKVRTNLYQGITTHRYFFSSGSDWPRTNCSLMSS